MRKLYFLLILTISIYSNAFGQRLEKFSEDKSEFTAQLGTYMTTSKQQTMEDIYKEFEKNFKGGMFSDTEFQQILKTSNSMLQYRMSASPYFMDYLNALMAVKKTDNPEQTFKDWHLMLDTMLADVESQRLATYLDFIRFSKDFLKKKKYAVPIWVQIGTS
ncbi:MAG: hypothetical protein IPJ74_22910 [Saprospiraceae bacterium]|nr:hypothetical protein [Saprospiraceae bacterium]